MSKRLYITMRLVRGEIVPVAPVTMATCPESPNREFRKLFAAAAGTAASFCSSSACTCGR